MASSSPPPPSPSQKTQEKTKLKPLLPWFLQVWVKAAGSAKNKLSQNKARLLSIPPSHFAERARWALDIYQFSAGGGQSGLCYTEDSHCPGAHSVYTCDITEGLSRSVPILMIPKKWYTAADIYDQKLHDAALQESTCLPFTPQRHTAVLFDSDTIIHFLSSLKGMDWLYPQKYEVQIKAFEQQCTKLAGTIRDFSYSAYMAPDQTDITDLKTMFSNSTPWAEQKTLGLVVPKMLEGMKAKVGIKFENIEDYWAQIQQHLDAMQKLLEAKEDGDKEIYFFGDSMSAADLTFSATMAPLVRPPEMAGIYNIPLSYHITDRTSPLLNDGKTSKGRYSLLYNHVCRLYRGKRYPFETRKKVKIQDVPSTVLCQQATPSA